MTTPEDYERAAGRLQLLAQPMGVAPGSRVLTCPSAGEASDYFGAPESTGRVIATIVDPGRTKPVPRTLQQAFPISEGYRFSGWHYRRPTRLDRICWAVVFGLVGVLVWWVIVTPKGHP